MGTNNNYLYDDALSLRDASLLAATATEATILDLGAGFIQGDLIIDVSAVEVASGNEKYTIHLEGSNVAAMTSGSVTLVNVPLGNATDPADAATGTGRFVIPFRNRQNGTTYRYVRIYTLVAGTIATGINFSAFLAKNQG